MEVNTENSESRRRSLARNELIALGNDRRGTISFSNCAEHAVKNWFVRHTGQRGQDGTNGVEVLVRPFGVMLRLNVTPIATPESRNRLSRTCHRSLTSK